MPTSFLKPLTRAHQQPFARHSKLLSVRFFTFVGLYYLRLSPHCATFIITSVEFLACSIQPIHTAVVVNRILWIVLVLLVFGAGSCSDSTVTDAGILDAGEGDGNNTDGSVSQVSECVIAQSETIACWTDSTSGLEWEYQSTPPLCDWQDAVAYCENLNACGHTDWRVPTIDELRSLVRGCTGTITGGPCPIHEGSAISDFTGDCFCNLLAGPGPGNCYWDTVFGDGCGLAGNPYWSSSVLSSGASTSRWSLGFHTARFYTAEETQFQAIRCTRGG